MKPWFCTVLNIYNLSYGSVADRAASHTVLLILPDIRIIGKARYWTFEMDRYRIRIRMGPHSFSCLEGKFVN